MKIENKNKRIVFLSCFHPNPGSLAATAAGVLHWDKKEFFISFLLAQLYWSTFWGVLFYNFGYNLFDVLVKNFSLALIAIVFFWTIKKIYLLKKA